MLQCSWLRTPGVARLQGGFDAFEKLGLVEWLREVANNTRLERSLAQGAHRGMQ